MKPTFALDLTREAIALLHRTPKGWLPIGEVGFDAPDLDETLDYLRKTALGLSPMGMACKVILPNSQILYTEVHAPGPSREDKRRQIAAALEGRTPYAVEDLVFDWSGKGQTVKVAVVARETLEEAEGFAAQHRLNPVSFVAIPEQGDFVGEPWFGPSAAAEAILAPGESVDRDREPVTILQRELPSAEPAGQEADMSEAEDATAVTDAATEDNEPKETRETEQTVEDVTPLPPARHDDADADEPLPGLKEALEAELPKQEAKQSAVPVLALPTEDDLDDSADEGDEAALAAALAGDTLPIPHADPASLPPTTPAVLVPNQVAASSEVASPRPIPDFALPEPVKIASGEIGPPTQSKALSEAEPEEAPFAHVTDTAAFPEDEAVPQANAAARQSGPTDPATQDDDLPPAPPAAAMMAFASRRAAGASAAARPLDGAVKTASPPASPGGGPVASRTAAPAAAGARIPQAPRPAATSRSFQGLVTAPNIPGARPKAKGKAGHPEEAFAATAAVGAGPRTVKSPARPGGTFGAVAPPRSRSGVALMVLIGLLLLFLAFIAMVSSYFLSRNGAAVSESALLADPLLDDPLLVVPGGVDVAAALPDVEDEMLADMQDPEGMTEPLPEADGPALAAGDAGALATESLDEAAIDPVDLAAPAVEAVDPETAPAAEPEAEAAASPELAPVPVADSTQEPAPATVVATDVRAAEAPVEDQDEIFLSAMDAPPPALDALALPSLPPVVDATPPAPLPPPAFGTVYRFDDKGLLVPTPEGILSPDGVMLFAGPPPRVPPARSEAAAAAALAAAALVPTAEAPPADAGPTATVSAADASLVTAGTEQDAEIAGDTPLGATPPADPALSGFRPRPRPDGLAPGLNDDASLADPATSDFAGIRPLARPQVVLAAAAAARPADLGAQGASLTAQAEADLAAAAALEAANPSVIAISRRPEPRPRDLSRAVEAAVAAAVREPEPEIVAAAAAPDLKPEEIDELDEPAHDSGGPTIPTSANVAKQATFTNAINLSKMNLIGTYGTDSRRTALVRQSNGRYKKVKVGDKIDGGTVVAITEGEVRYQKGGKLLTLAMPKA